MPPGQPHAYKPEYCQMLLDHMSKGLSYETFAAIVGTSRQTLYNWEKQFPVFFDTKKMAQDLCQLWWEKQGNAGLWVNTDSEGASEKLQAAIWIFNMKARFRWKDETIKADEIQEKAVLTIEDKKNLLIEAKKEIQRLEEEINTKEVIKIE